MINSDFLEPLNFQLLRSRCGSARVFYNALKLATVSKRERAKSQFSLREDQIVKKVQLREDQLSSKEQESSSFLE